MTAVGTRLKLFHLYSCIGIPRLLSWSCGPWWSVLLNTLCSFASDSVFFFVNDFSFTPLFSVVLTTVLQWALQNTEAWMRNFSFMPLCSVVLYNKITVSTTEHKGVKEISFTKKKTESLGNGQSVFNRSSTNQDRSSMWLLPVLQYKGNLCSTTTAVTHSCTVWSSG
jgi:hypothetical protein